MCIQKLEKVGRKHQNELDHQTLQKGSLMFDYSFPRLPIRPSHVGTDEGPIPQLLLLLLQLYYLIQLISSWIPICLQVSLSCFYAPGVMRLSYLTTPAQFHLDFLDFSLDKLYRIISLHISTHDHTHIDMLIIYNCQYSIASNKPFGFVTPVCFLKQFLLL